jgi:hypothetical protein
VNPLPEMVAAAKAAFRVRPCVSITVSAIPWRRSSIRNTASSRTSAAPGTSPTHRGDAGVTGLRESIRHGLRALRGQRL